MSKLSFRGCAALCALTTLGAGAPLQGHAQSLPLDPAVHTGKLANGFTYYIRKNTAPRNRVTFYLVNKIGSMQETEAQRGLAHMMEHMSFNGTTHYPKNELVEYLQKSGVRFGADLNAYTAFDETVYQLPLPSDDSSIVRNGLQIMRDWAGEATLDPTEIDKERGVVLEEKRLRNGAQQRFQDQMMPLQVNHSRYADRLPIGLESVLKTFTPETIRSFYKDWYRPDLQALIVVGDIDVATMEAQVKQMFATLKNPAKEKKREYYTIALTGKNQFMALTDAEQQRTQVQVMIKQPELVIRNREDYRRFIVMQMMNGALQERFQQITTQGNPPFLQVQAGLGGFMGGLDAFTVNIAPKPGQLKEAFNMVWTEVQRMQRFGVTAAELERGKKNFLQEFEAAWKERDKTPSDSYVKEYVQYFLKGAASPGIDAEYALVKTLVPGITLDDVKALAKQAIRDTDRDIYMEAPEKDKASLPDAATVDGWIAAVARAPLQPWQEAATGQSLLETMPVAGHILQRSGPDSLGVYTCVLSNGIKVLVKPTDYKNDQVMISAFSAGGTSVYPDPLFMSASNAAQLVAANGLGNMDPVALSKLLTGKNAMMQPFIQERYQGFQGGASPADLETALQLLYLEVTAPRKDTNIFNGLISRAKASLAGRGNNPDAVFADTAAAIMGMHHYRRQPLTEARLEEVKLDEAYRVYKESFANAGLLTFVLVGNIDTARLYPLLEQYVASLPGHAGTSDWKDLGIHIPEGKVNATVYKGNDNKAVVNLVFSGTYAYNADNNMQLTALGSILQFRITERIRETEGGAYSPRAGVTYNKLPEGRYAFSVQITCAPANVEKLIAATKEEMDKLKTNGPSEDDVAKFVAETRRSQELQLRDNGFWMQYLVGRLQNGDPMNAVLHFDERLAMVTRASVQQTAAKYFTNENEVRLVHLPEAK
ncbi:peptidase M16 [Chitinophaga parva]|uniref:Peptidase M16 n=1 Tax=Chitinophaga parva TaxID=2169414 RepID=A0A2T7BHN1_9BACT|nr:M16 family metallopeptidase [Chitinophaga parva]PUZ25791.1 peptidase M16 [Chitinophaga parva]